MKITSRSQKKKSQPYKGITLDLSQTETAVYLEVDASTILSAFKPNFVLERYCPR